ncbi:hypothetical protein RGF97_28715 [Streptomyces roseicoloratus]|uniref:Uncharacterized protein n=1 Tax=Streptomyces roseicoloratus TaxID=2508722 RepID=A0ABY9S0P9_9ACTN|nr:hypothetical protein [Streptomyces roseicoloratus]WMX47997.1 hypothetical protein RGF97_28715 [Streptomyces roseicoloratus]
MLPLPEGSWWDRTVLRYDGSRLTLAAGHDLSYGHGLQVAFTDTVCLRCPTAFSDPEFREATAEERAEIVRLVGEDPPVPGRLRRGRVRHATRPVSDRRR